MTWSANITQKGIQDKAFLVNVSYTNGTNQFNEIIDMTGGTFGVLSSKIASRLDTLNTTQTLIPQVVLGPFAPGAVVQTALDAFLQACRRFNSCKKAVDLGLIKATDPLYTNAQSAMLAAYDPAFIDAL